jgi:hypothetical protein
MHVSFGDAQDLHLLAQHFKGGFGGLRRFLFLSLQPPGALLFGSKPPLQFRHAILK